ncbi:MAG: response regulator [Eubacteriales bacterium]|nr:response regulator [Eubacteriales bacterium]
MYNQFQEIRKLRVVLIDDDILALSSAEEIIKSPALNLELVGAFDNARTALLKLPKLNADLVITDIQMPQMNGLDLLQSIKKDFPNIEVLLLTAYSDFDYARRAVSLGASGYILKHEFNVDSLKNNLAPLIAKIETEQIHNHAHQYVLIEKLLLPPPISEKSIEEFNEIFCPHKTPHVFYLALVRKFQPFWVNHDDEASTFRSQREALRERIEQKLEYINLPKTDAVTFKYVCLPWLQGQILVFLSFSGLVSILEQTELLHIVLRELSGAVAPPDMHINCVLASNPFMQASDLYPMLKQLEECQPKCIFLGNKRIISIQELNNNVKSMDKSLLTERKEFQNALTSNSSEQSFSKLKNYFDLAVKTQSVSDIHICTDGMSTLLEKRLSNVALNNEYKEELKGTSSASQLWNLFEEFYEKAKMLPKHSYSPRIAEIIQIIHEYYMEDLTIHSIADKLNLNEEYLNKLFRSEVGTGFSKYLTNYRMKIACQLLKSGKLQINEVASHVGYQSSQYFSVTFHRVTGYSPSDYVLLDLEDFSIDDISKKPPVQ